MDYEYIDIKSNSDVDMSEISRLIDFVYDLSTITESVEINGNVYNPGDIDINQVKLIKSMMGESVEKEPTYTEKILMEYGLTPAMLSTEEINTLRKIGFDENGEPNMDKIVDYLDKLSENKNV